MTYNYQNKNFPNRKSEKKINFDLKVQEIILAYKRDEYKEFINYAEKFAENSKNVSSNQIRQFYDEIIDIYENKNNVKEIKKGLTFLKVKLTYSQARKVITEDFSRNLQKFIDLVINNSEDIEKNFKIFKEFMEAFVAYNKLYSKN